MRINDLYSQLQTHEDHHDETKPSFELIQKAMDFGEFTTYFQLIWSDSDKRFVKAEALTRWIKPDGTTISPGVYIPYLEEGDLSPKFLQRLIEQSIRFLNQLKKRGISDMTVSINISPFQLRELNIVAILESACLKNKISPSAIQIEITERSVLEKDIDSLNNLYKLKEKGFKLALDDFGVGFSSLDCLRDLPLDVVKLDKSLIRNAQGKEKSEKLLRGIIHLLKDLDFGIVCEGIETEKEAALVSSLGCTLHQGFLYHKASDPETIIKGIESDSNNFRIVQ